MSATNTGHDSDTNDAGFPPAPSEAHQRADAEWVPSPKDDESAGWVQIPAKAVQAECLSGDFFVSTKAQARLDELGTSVAELLRWFNKPRDAVVVGETLPMDNGLQAYFGYDLSKSGPGAFPVRIDVAPPNDPGELIHAYSRADAIGDGVLVDVSQTAREIGFVYPVALTRAAWEDCVAWAKEDNHKQGAYQEEAGRLWDVLWLARLAARAPAVNESERRFNLYRVPRDGKTSSPQWASLRLVIGPGDDADPVITILVPNED